MKNLDDIARTNTRLISDDIARLLTAELERENLIWRRWRELEPWESRLKREIWRRSLRGRWWMLRYRLAQRTEPARRRIAHAIYSFSEDD